MVLPWHTKRDRPYQDPPITHIDQEKPLTSFQSNGLQSPRPCGKLVLESPHIWLAYFSRIGFAVLLGAVGISADLLCKTNARNLQSAVLTNITKPWPFPRLKSSIVKGFLNPDFSWHKGFFVILSTLGIPTKHSTSIQEVPHEKTAHVYALLPIGHSLPCWELKFPFRESQTHRGKRTESHGSLRSPPVAYLPVSTGKRQPGCREPHR